MTRWMLRASILLGVLSLVPGNLAALQSQRSGGSARILVFVDGTRMPVQSFEIKERVVQFMSLEGKLRSVPRSYVNIPATEGQGSPAAPAPRPARPAPPPPPVMPEPTPEPPPEPDPVEPVMEPETQPEMMPEAAPEVTPDVMEDEPMPEPMAPAESPAMPEAVAEPAPMPPPTQPAPAPPMPEPAPMASAPSPSDNLTPPSWNDPELAASLIAPSSAWEIKEMPASFDVAVTLTNSSTEARATLALIRQRLRSRKDFQRVLDEVESSISSAPGYRSLSNGVVDLQPYTAHEFRFMKDVGFVGTFNQLLVVYSRDLAYVLSMTCPESRMDESIGDFQAIMRGLNIEKSSRDLRP